MKFLKEPIKNQIGHLLFFYSHLKHRIFIGMSLNISVGILDGFGLAMFLPLFQMMDNTSTVDNHQLGGLGFLVTGLKYLGIELSLTSVLIILVSFFLLKGIATYVNHVYHAKMRAFFVSRIRTAIVSNLTELSFKHFVTSDVGRMQNTTTGEVSRLADAFGQYFEMTQKLILVFIYVLFAFFVDFKLALLITVGGVLTNFLFTKIFRITKQVSTRISDKGHVYQGLVIQFVANFKYLKASGVIKKMKELLITTVYGIEAENLMIGKLNGIVHALREPLMVIVIGLVIYVNVTFFDGVIGAILVSLLFFYRALSALVLAQGFYNNFLALSGSVENVISFNQELVENAERNTTVKNSTFQHMIELKNISFGYPTKQIIHEVNLTIDKNKTVAFVGESGSGKTTLINLITGLMPVDSGHILIDGQDIEELSKDSYRSRIGYITQEPVIFNDSIFNNITLWDMPSLENLARFNRVLKQAELQNFINELPGRADTLLGNNGINISGGQKQRISIARELYKDVDILVLDEATSALDSETEKSIQEQIELLKGSVTILVVAHRLSTIKNADMIVLMEQGKILDINNFNELKSTSARFNRMVALQNFE